MRPKAVFFYALLGIVFLLTLTAIGIITGQMLPRSDSLQVLRSQSEASPSSGTAGEASHAIDEEATPSATSTAVPLYLADTGLDVDCTYTFLYWREHPESWLVDNILVGEAVYDKAQIQAYFSGESQDPQVLLHQQFFAAILNTIKGADARQVETILQAASTYIFAHHRDREITAEEDQQAIKLALALQEYNLGNSGPGSCADQPDNLILVAAPTAGAPTATQLVTSILVNLVTPTPSVTPIRVTATRQAPQSTAGPTGIPLQPTDTAQNTPSPSATASGTSTLSPAPPTASQTLTPAPSSSPTSTTNPTPPNTATIQPTNVPSPTSSATSQPTATPQPTSTSTKRPTNTPRPSNTPHPTKTSPPTDSPEPTNTRRPTNTPRPSNTPLPTNTPVPPTTIPPSSTPLPPTDTPLPPTDTPMPTSTPEPPTTTSEPPTSTPEPPTSTPEPPTSTPEPPTSTPEPPTATPIIIIIITVVVPILPPMLP